MRGSWPEREELRTFWKLNRAAPMRKGQGEGCGEKSLRKEEHSEVSFCAMHN